jgi:hypothetical protein
MAEPSLVEALEPGSVWRFVETTMSPRGSDLRLQVLWDTSLVFRFETPDELWFQYLEDHAAWSLPVYFASKATQVSSDTWSLILEPADFDREEYYAVHSDPNSAFLRFGTQRSSDGSYPASGQPFPVQMTLQRLSQAL